MNKNTKMHLFTFFQDRMTHSIKQLQPVDYKYDINCLMSPAAKWNKNNKLKPS